MPAIDRATFHSIYEKYWEKVYRYALKILGDAQMAEDIVQQVFVSLWERRATLHIQNSEAYLIRAVKFACMDELKKKLRYDSVEEKEINLKESNTQTDDRMLYQDLEKTIDRLLDPISGKSKQMFRMRFEEGLDNNTIASNLQLSEKTVRNGLSKTVGMIRARLKAEGYKR